jgi:hypothetical protein
MYVRLSIVVYPNWFGWAGFLSMALFRFPLWLSKGLRFWKLMGTGKNGTFDKNPDWNSWVVLEVYDTPTSTPSFITWWWKIFKTTNGRDVIDGRGIEPDVKIEQKDFSRLTSMVYGNNLVFNYATKYHLTHSKIAPPGEFKLELANKLFGVND